MVWESKLTTRKQRNGFSRLRTKGLAPGAVQSGCASEGEGRGVPQDVARALKLYEAAAAQGHAKAQFNLGVIYRQGKGQSSEQNLERAIELYRSAAESGFVSAQFNLGVLYAQGIGVPQDYAEAFRWYYQAAEQDFANAQNNIGDCYENGNGVKQDYGEAIRWYLKAAEKGISVAQLNLGQFCIAMVVVSNRIMPKLRKMKLQLAVDQGLEKARKSPSRRWVAAGHVKPS